MAKKVTSAIVYELAKTVKNNVEQKYDLPRTVKYNNVEYTYAELAYAFTYNINHLGATFDIPNVKLCSGWTGDPMAEEVLLSDYKDQAKRIVQYIVQHGQCPNYVTTVRSKKRASAKLFVYTFAKIVVFYNQKKQLPNYCVYQTSVFTQTNKPSTGKVETPEEVLAYFEKVFGVTIKYIDDVMEILDGRGYAYYYDDMYSNKETIDRIKAKKGVNCTDVTHIVHNIGLALINKYKRYKKVETIHVRCSGGDGHVRSKFTNTNGTIFYRDGACALSANGRGAYCNWCTSGYTLLATNPSWFMKDLNR